MFYDLTDQQIQNIRKKIYPQELSGEFLKNVIVNNYGSTETGDNSFRIFYNFKDGLENDASGKQIFKVFNNEFAKKYMKLKLFEILSQTMLDEITANPLDITILEQIISKYGAVSRDLKPSLDFNGDKINADQHLRFRNLNNSIELTFDTTFLLSRPKIQYFTLGAIFYLDKNDYIADQQVEQKFIDDRVLVNNLLTYKLYVDNSVVSDMPIQDFRLVKEIFKETKYLDSLLSIISSPNGFNKVTKINQLVENSNLSTIATTSENYNLTSNFAKDRLIKKIKLNPKPKNSFSNVFYSRNYLKNLGILFNINFEEILKENTAFGSLLIRSDLKDELYKKCKISNIKILRRKVNKQKNNQFLPMLNTINVLVSSGESKEKNIISTIDDENATLSEIDLNTSSFFKLRTFTVVDKKIFSATSGYYQYGFELEISNAINQFLLNYADSLMPQISALNQYLEETNKIAKVVGDDKNGYSLQGSYDPQKRSFTPIFIKNYAIPRNNAPSFSKIVNEAIESFVTTIKMFGLMKETESQMINTLASMLSPTTTNAEIINYFINIYQKLISQIRTLVKQNSNNSFKISKWFTNDYVDTNQEINLGYKFISFDSYQGLGILKSDQFRNLINSNLSRYSINKNTDTTQIGDNDFAYLPPLEIYSLNKTLQLNVLNNNSKAIADLDFAELEIDIKNIKSFGTNIKLPNLNTANIGKFQKKLDVASKSTKLLEKFSLQSKEEFIELPSTAPVQQNLPLEKNENVDSTDLILALSKQFDLEKNNYLKFINKPTPKVDLEEYYANSPKKSNLIGKNLNIANQKLALTNENIEQNLENIEMPIYVRLLLEDKNPIIKNTDNYKKSLKLNSKFQFLFNTLHVIEILDYADSSLRENWTLLTRAKIQSLSENGLYLCRLRNYKNLRLGIEGIEEVKLPIYEQYFLFSRSGLVTLPSFKAIKDLPTIKTQLKLAVGTKMTNLINNLGITQTPFETRNQTTQQSEIKNPFAPANTNRKKRE